MAWEIKGGVPESNHSQYHSLPAQEGNKIKTSKLTYQTSANAAKGADGSQESTSSSHCTSSLVLGRLVLKTAVETASGCRARGSIVHRFHPVVGATEPVSDLIVWDVWELAWLNPSDTLLRWWSVTSILLGLVARVLLGLLGLLVALRRILGCGN
jgi:hypothetical protein